MLRDCEEALADLDEQYLRAVHPNHLDDSGAPRSIAFRPPASDDPQFLSGARSTKQTAEGLATERRSIGRVVAGVWTLSVGDLDGQWLSVVDDSECPNVDTTGHTYVDMTPAGLAAAGGSKKAVSKWMARHATRCL